MLAEDSCHDLDSLLDDLDRDVTAWGPACHACWAIWGIVQAKEDIEAEVDEPEFDYIAYATGRMTDFRLEVRRLGLVAH